MTPGYSLGTAVVLTPRNQTNATPFAHISDVSILNNRIVEAQRGMLFPGDDDLYPSGPLRCVKVENNLFDQLPGDRPWSRDIPQTHVDGRLFTNVTGRTSGTIDVQIEHNTAFNSGPVLYATRNGPRLPSVGFIFRNNLVHASVGGFVGWDGVAALDAAGTFDEFFAGTQPPSGATFGYDDLVGASRAEQQRYPMCAPGGAVCLFSSSDAAVGFIAEERGSAQVVQHPGAHPGGSPDYLRCSHGTHDLGAYDWTALGAALRDAHPEP